MSENKLTLLDIRTGKDSKRTAEAMMELFSTLPQGKLWQNVFKRKDRVSFEIVLDEQLINFYLGVPEEMVEYMRSLILADYPEALVAMVGEGEDPMKDYQIKEKVAKERLAGEMGIGVEGEAGAEEEKWFRKEGYIEIEQAAILPLKDYRAFEKETDSLASVLSVLSKATVKTKAAIQLVIDLDDENVAVTAPAVATDDEGKPKGTALKSAKEEEKAWWVTWRVVTMTTDEVRSEALLHNLFSAFNSLAKPEGNNLKLRSILPWRKEIFIKDLVERKANLWHRRSLLSIYELASIYHFPNNILSIIPNIAWGKNLLGEPPVNLPIIRKEYGEEMKKEINVFAQATYKNEMVKYGISRSDRRRHMYVIGKTGTGKSTLLANMAVNDLRHNEGFCFIDPHGDAIETLLDYIPSHRINDVVYFNPADGERTVKINLFEGKNLVHRELIASGIVSIFQKLYAYSWGPRLEHFLRNALLTLLQTEEAKMSDIVDLFTNKNFRKKIVDELQDPILKNFWKGEFEPLMDRQRQEAIAPILNKVGQFVSSPLVRNVVNSHKSSFSIEDIMDEGKILLVNLSQGRLGEDNATLLGAMLITKIQLAAMGRVHIPEEQRRDFYLYVDEFQNFATDSFNKILSEARKYRLSLVLANQYIAQIPEEVRKAIFGNCGTMVSFVMGSEDAQIFSAEYSNKYTADDLVSLNRHQIVNRISIDNVISSPFPAWTLPLAKNTNMNREKVIKVSRERYAGKNEGGEVRRRVFTGEGEEGEGGGETNGGGGKVAGMEGGGKGGVETGGGNEKRVDGGKRDGNLAGGGKEEPKRGGGGSGGSVGGGNADDGKNGETGGVRRNEVKVDDGETDAGAKPEGGGMVMAANGEKKNNGNENEGRGGGDKNNGNGESKNNGEKNGFEKKNGGGGFTEERGPRPDGNEMNKKREFERKKGGFYKQNWKFEKKRERSFEKGGGEESGQEKRNSSAFLGGNNSARNEGEKREENGVK